MIVKLLNEYHLEFLSLKGGCTGSSESTHVKMPHCWKLHVAAQMCSPNEYFLCVFFILNELCDITQHYKISLFAFELLNYWLNFLIYLYEPRRRDFQQCGI